MNRFHSPQLPVQWQWVSLSGPDARDFLHRVTTVHVNALQPGRGASGCLLTAQGRIKAWFRLWNCADSEYGFELDAGASGHWKQSLIGTIDQLHFAEKFTLTEPPTLECRWIFPEGDIAGLPALQPGETALDAAHGLRFCHQGAQDFGHAWITVWGERAKLEEWLSKSFGGPTPVEFAELERWRIQALRPRVDTEITEETIPLEAGLIETIAQNKGCYPGQEVIERTISIGSPARRLVKIEGSGALPSAGEALLTAGDSPTEIGKITSIAKLDGGQFLALGFVRKIQAKESTSLKAASGAACSVNAVAPYAPA